MFLCYLYFLCAIHSFISISFLFLLYIAFFFPHHWTKMHNKNCQKKKPNAPLCHLNIECQTITRSEIESCCKSHFSPKQSQFYSSLLPVNIKIKMAYFFSLYFSIKLPLTFMSLSSRFKVAWVDKILETLFSVEPGSCMGSHLKCDLFPHRSLSCFV